MNRKKPVTQQDIAARLGVTVHTVSKAMRGLPGMSEETRRSVFRVARELGYRSKAQEETLAMEKLTGLSGNSYRFALVSRWNGNLLRLLYEGLSGRLSEFGHRLDLFLYTAETGSPGEIERWYENSGISYTAGMFVSFGFPKEIEHYLLALPIPRVLINYPETGAEADSVIWDVYDATARCVRMLVGAGHTDILYVGDTVTHRGFRRRWQAFVEAMHEAGLSAEPADHLVEGIPSEEEWMSLFRLRWEARRPTAVLCAIENDLPWIYYACSRMGLKIPEDVSVVSLETAESSFLPQLTHPVMPVRETGVRAADRMLWRIANPHLPYEHLRLQCRWHAGGTLRTLH